MKVFISWSGKKSLAIAVALNEWLPRVIQALKPFISTDIEKGTKWANEIDSALEGTGFGIVCLTQYNLDSTWIHYEVGALSKTQGTARIWTFLIDVRPADVVQPLGNFQHTLPEKDEVFALLRAINGHLRDAGAEPLADHLLTDAFDRLWPDLEEKLKQANEISEATPRTGTRTERAGGTMRDERELLDEILDSSRNQNRTLAEILSDLELSRSIASRSITPQRNYENDFYKEIRVPLPDDFDHNMFPKIVETWQSKVPGITVGLQHARGTKPVMVVTFPCPMDEDYVDDLLAVIRRESGVNWRGDYSMSPVKIVT